LAEKLSKQYWFFNSISTLEIRFIETQGRGIFAALPIKKNDLILVEKALAVGNSSDHLTKKCIELAQH